MSAEIGHALRETVLGLKGILSDQTEDTLFGHHNDKELSISHLIWMCDRILDQIDVWPLDKSGRWIGFVQGVMACRGILNVTAERDRTRPLFHKAYSVAGVEIPPTVDRS